MNKNQAINRSWEKFSKKISEVTSDLLKLTKEFNDKKSVKNIKDIRNKIQNL